MKLFGEYLVEKGVVGADALAAALVEQVRRTPSVCQVVHEQRLLSTDDFLAVMARQSRDRGGFVEACRAMGHWNEAFQTRVEHAIAAVRIPLGQLLVQRGDARFEDLSRALDEFLADGETGIAVKGRLGRTSWYDAWGFLNQTFEPLMKSYDAAFSANLGAAMSALAADRALRLRLSRAGRAHVARNHSIGPWVDGFGQLLDRVRAGL
jgi:hypothetical protein